MRPQVGPDEEQRSVSSICIAESLLHLETELQQLVVFASTSYSKLSFRIVYLFNKLDMGNNCFLLIEREIDIH